MILQLKHRFGPDALRRGSTLRNVKKATDSDQQSFGAQKQ